MTLNLLLYKLSSLAKIIKNSVEVLKVPIDFKCEAAGLVNVASKFNFLRH